MTPEEAVRRVEFWTTNVAETAAWGSTRDPEAGVFFEAKDIPAEQFSKPNGALVYAISVPRYFYSREEGRVDNLLYSLVLQEIERRKG